MWGRCWSCHLAAIGIGNPSASFRPSTLLVGWQTIDGVDNFWRWFVGKIVNIMGEVLLELTLRLHASCIVMIDATGAVWYVESFVINYLKLYPRCIIIYPKGLAARVRQIGHWRNSSSDCLRFTVCGVRAWQLLIHYPQMTFIENGKKLAVVQHQRYKLRFVPNYFTENGGVWS